MHNELNGSLQNVAFYLFFLHFKQALGLMHWMQSCPLNTVSACGPATLKHSDIFTIMHISGNNGEECPAGQHFDLKSANAIQMLPSNISLRTLFYQSQPFKPLDSIFKHRNSLKFQVFIIQCCFVLHINTDPNRNTTAYISIRTQQPVREEWESRRGTWEDPATPCSPVTQQQFNKRPTGAR